MNQNDLKWYQDNGFPTTVVNLAKEITPLIEEYYGITFEGLFISNSKDENQEMYPSLWLYNDEYIVESKDFLSETHLNIDIARYKKNVKYIQINSHNLKLSGRPTNDSRIKLMVSIGNNISCSFEAVGINCSKLNELAKKFIEVHKSSL